MKNTALLACLLALLSSSPAMAKDPIVIIEGGVRTAYGRQGIIDFAKDFEANPRDLTLEVLGHPFGFAVNAAGCAAACTALTFTSVELGINRTFTGANTAEISSKFKDFVKSEEFLKPFMRLINSGAGAQLTGSPVGTVGSVVRTTFQDTMFQTVRTAEERAARVPPGKDPQFSGGFAQFTTDGFEGKVLAVTPGFTLDFGQERDKHLKFSFPIARIDLEGLRTYRAGMTLQYLHPVKFGDGWTWTLGPGASYQTTVSVDLPNFTGLLGGAMSSSLQHDWERCFATAAGYYGRFGNLGGIDTDILANIYGWGGQAGLRWSRRWVTALQAVGIHERVAGFRPTTYHTVGTAVTYKIFNKFNTTFSISRLFGLPKQRFVDVGLGSAWFF
jgi:hypothetical protein